MASLLQMLSQNSPDLQTRKALILAGLQNDFLSPDGKMPVDPSTGFLDKLQQLAPQFREFGDLIWVRSEYEANRANNHLDDSGDCVIANSETDDGDDDESERGDQSSRASSERPRVSLEAAERTAAEDEAADEELFLTRTASREPCCVPGTKGIEYAPEIKDLIDKKDLQVTKTYYSAFGSTSLLLTLRSRLVTELFLCGCTTNLSVFATALDAARYGIKVVLVEDCLGYRRKKRHDKAIRKLRQMTGAGIMSSSKVLEILKNPPASSEDEEESDESEEDGVREENETPVKRSGQEEPPDTMEQLLEADSDDDEDGDEDEEEGDLPPLRRAVGDPLRLDRPSPRAMPAYNDHSRVPESRTCH